MKTRIKPGWLLMLKLETSLYRDRDDNPDERAPGVPVVLKKGQILYVYEEPDERDWDNYRFFGVPRAGGNAVYFDSLHDCVNDSAFKVILSTPKAEEVYNSEVM